MTNTYTTIRLSNECYLIKLRLENGALWLTGDGRGWWRAGDVTPQTPLKTRTDVVEDICHNMRLSEMPAELLSILDNILSPRHFARVPLGAEYSYTLTYTAGGITVKRKHITPARKRG